MAKKERGQRIKQLSTNHYAEKQKIAQHEWFEEICCANEQMMLVNNSTNMYNNLSP
jgi:hypothetical protein